jgi:hypothetical protein
MNNRSLAALKHVKIELKTVTVLSTNIRPIEPVADNKQTNERTHTHSCVATLGNF